MERGNYRWNSVETDLRADFVASGSWLLCLTPLLLLVLSGCGGGSRSGGTEPSSGRLTTLFAPAVNNERPVKKYVQEVGDRLVKAAGEMQRQSGITPPKNVQFQIVHSPVPNVYPADRGHVLVYSGLLQRCQMEDELAAVMAHGYAHLCLDHLRGKTANEEEGTPAEAVLRVAEHRFTPAEEAQADELAVLLYARAGWDPANYPAIFERLGSPSARLEQDRSRIDRLPPASRDWAQPPIADDRRFADFKQRGVEGNPRRPAPAETERLLAAMPSCLLAEDLPEQKRAQRDLAAPPIAETPNSFEKGPRARQ